VRILFLSHYFPPEVNAPASRTFEHCRAWAQAGHEVAVVTCVPNHPAGKIYPGYRNGWHQRETVQGITVHRLLTFVSANEGFALRTLNYFFYLFMATVVAPFLPRTDIVVSTSPQFFCGLAGYLVSRIKRVPWVLEIRDLWPESIVAVGAMKKSAVIRFLERLESFAYRRADHIVSVTESFQRHILGRGGSPDRLTVIKNGVDLDFFASDKGDGGLARELGIEGRFVAAYVGTHGMAHGLDTILRAAELTRERPDIVYLLAGDGAQRENITRMRDELKLANVLILGQQPKERMPQIWALTGVSLVLLRDQPLFLSVIPSKIFESLAMKKPIILGVRGESAALVQASGGGICITPESATELAAAVLRLADHPEIRANLGATGRRYVETNFDRRVLAARFEALLKSIVG
jgi:glycosyltransferase involved in cell wall biosynthesis